MANMKFSVEMRVLDQDNDFVIFRIADVYLMRGEAYFRLGNEALALEDINYIREIRDAAPFTSP